MDLIATLEAVLFAAGRPLSLESLTRSLRAEKSALSAAVDELASRHNHERSGIHILRRGNEVQMSTNPAAHSAVSEFVKSETEGELTKAQLETLTVIAYRGPITRPELEEIRGVNCALILRVLLMRGLIDEREDSDKLTPVYEISFNAMRRLGITSPSELPEYESLHAHENIERQFANAQ